MKEYIREFSGKYRFLSNFWSCYILYELEEYPSVENAYQAAKMKNISDRLRFTDCKASEAKHLGRVLPMLDNWDKVKRKVMYDLVYQKFDTYEDLKHKLLRTGEAILEEGNWWGDTYWGTVNGKGQNHLGKILMKVRTELHGK